jgi:hypothetical protein
MPNSYNYATDPALPSGVARLMQAAADRRAKAGLISDDGQTHTNAKCRDLYNEGHGVLSSAYLDARFK